MESKKNKRAVYAVTSLIAVAMLAGCSVVGGEETGTTPGAGESEPGIIESAFNAMSDPVVTLPESTALSVRLVPTLSTETHEVNDTFEATLDEPVTEGGETVLEAGTRVWGKVVEADKGGRVEGRAHIAVLLTEIETADGERVNISTNTLRRQAPATKKDDAKKIGIGAGVGAAIGAIAGGGKGAAIGAAAGGGAGTGAVLATRGEPAVFESETLLRFTLQHPVTIG